MADKKGEDEYFFYFRRGQPLPEKKKRGGMGPFSPEESDGRVRDWGRGEKKKSLGTGEGRSSTLAMGGKGRYLGRRGEIGIGSITLQ